MIYSAGQWITHCLINKRELVSAVAMNRTVNV